MQTGRVCSVVTVLLLLLLLSPGPARSDARIVKLSDLLMKSTVVSIARLTKTAPDGSLVFRVVRPVKGPRAGKELSYRRASYALDRIKQKEVLLACHKSVCPILGLRRGNFFVFPTHWGGGAPLLVSPAAIEEGSIRRVAKGKPAKPICLRLSFGFLDQSKQKETITFRGLLGDGEGKASGPLLGKAPWPATVKIGIKDRTGQAVVYLTATFKEQGQQIPFHFVATGALTSAGGCYSVSGYGHEPLARDRASFVKMLRGKLSPQVLARGTLQLKRGKGLKGGTYKATVLTESGGYPLVIRTGVGGRTFDRTVQRKDRDRRRTRIGFAVRKSNVSPSYPRLFFDLGDVRALSVYVGEHLDLAFKISKTGQIRSPLYLQRNRNAKPVPVGTIVLRDAPADR